MIALLRSDAYRVLRSRWIWVFAAFVAFLLFAPAVMMRSTDMGPIRYDDLTGSALSMGSIRMLAAALSGVACCTRTDNGFVRSILSSLDGRGRVVWFAEKCVFSLALTAALIAFAFAVELLALLVSGVPVANPEPAWQVAAWLGCTWLCAAPYVVLTTLVGHLTRSEGVTMAFAVLSSGGLLEGGLLIGIDFLHALLGGEFLTVTAAVGPWLPAEIASAVGAGARTMLSAENAVQLAPALRALIVCPPVAAVAIAVDALLVSRRDAA